MKDSFLHIVCLDSPAPPDYGGAIDMYYKVKALSQTGRKIILHYFNYRPRSIANLEKYCYRIYSYPRVTGFKAISFSLPYIVSSRLNKDLINRLNADEYPLLLEGIHCTGVLPYLDKNRRIVIRMHNDEKIYYKHLTSGAKDFFKKLYYHWESKLLGKYQSELDKETVMACLSESDIDIFKEKYGFTNTHFIPCFIPWQKISSMPGKGTYCLYHGNLQISENSQAAIWLVQNVFSHIQIPFFIAGKGISHTLKKATERLPHIQLIQNPSIEEIDSLIKNAHINVLPSMNQTGVKLKILHALFKGRFCITNENGLKGTGLKNEALICQDPNQWVHLISELMQTEFNERNFSTRSNLIRLYNNEINARKLNELL